MGTERCHGARKGGFVEGDTSHRALSVPWSNPVDAAPAQPTQRTEHLGRGKNSRKKSEPSTHCQHECYNFVELGKCQGQNRDCGDTEAFGKASGAPAAHLAQRGPGSGAEPVPAVQHELQHLHTPRARSPRTLARQGLEHQKTVLCVHKPLP